MKQELKCTACCSKPNPYQKWRDVTAWSKSSGPRDLAVGLGAMTAAKGGPFLPVCGGTSPRQRDGEALPGRPEAVSDPGSPHWARSWYQPTGWHPSLALVRPRQGRGWQSAPVRPPSLLAGVVGHGSHREALAPVVPWWEREAWVNGLNFLHLSCNALSCDNFTLIKRKKPNKTLEGMS